MTIVVKKKRSGQSSSGGNDERQSVMKVALKLAKRRKIVTNG